MSQSTTTFARNPAIELYRVLLMFGIVSLHTLCAAGLGFSLLARWVMFCVGLDLLRRLLLKNSN